MKTTKFEIIVAEGLRDTLKPILISKVWIRFKFGGKDYGTYIRFGDETLDEDQIAEAGRVLILQALRALDKFRGNYPSVGSADSSPDKGSHDTKGE